MPFSTSSPKIILFLTVVHGVSGMTCDLPKFFNRWPFSLDRQLRGIAKRFYKISALGLPGVLA
jgi:hypothetical protein